MIFSRAEQGFCFFPEEDADTSRMVFHEAEQRFLLLFLEKEDVDTSRMIFHEAEPCFLLLSPEKEERATLGV
jgi:hypothetical protein